MEKGVKYRDLRRGEHFKGCFKALLTTKLKQGIFLKTGFSGVGVLARASYPRMRREQGGLPW